MAYRFKLKETLRENVRRIAVEQIEKALAHPREGDDRAGLVHQARKSIKRTRALLRTVQTGLDGDTYRNENAALRRIARALSPVRDWDVLRATMARLEGRGGKRLETAINWFTAELDKAPPALPVGADGADALVAQAIGALFEAKERLAGLQVEGEVPDVLSAGFTDCRRRARDALARAEANPADSESLHDVRKAVQIYQRQQALVTAIWPEVQMARVQVAKRLAVMLGEAQDLSVLASAVRAARPRSGSPRAHAARIMAACGERQSELREDALPMAALLFGGRPKAAGAEVAASWVAAAAMAASRKRKTRGQTTTIPGKSVVDA